MVKFVAAAAALVAVVLAVSASAAPVQPLVFHWTNGKPTKFTDPTKPPPRSYFGPKDRYPPRVLTDK
ncbi:uncharacterized protein PSFLO_00767 [Pseudozyma flocculosa]|uniref:Uncharacterized protein n=1 Tax=Pseudozyma flocculosa TaxID=84751 RepID=A0A5C3EUT1_9BASI|nr:uncharacterized protein PSFLO_00767 [Pseudozyma flocculosa]